MSFTGSTPHGTGFAQAAQAVRCLLCHRTFYLTPADATSDFLCPRCTHTALAGGAAAAAFLKRLSEAIGRMLP